MIHLTGFGARALAFHVVVATTFFAVPYSNLYFLALAFLTTFAALGVLWCWHNLHGISAELQLPRTTAAGADIVGSLVLRGRPRRTVWSARVVVRLADGTVLTRALDDLVLDDDGAAERVPVPLPGQTRGTYNVLRAWIDSDHPHGTVRRRLPLPCDRDQLVVYPAPVAERSRDHDSLIAAEGTLTSTAAAAAERSVAGLRTWRSGDEVRSVHWRATARRGTPVVREWEFELDEGCEVLLDRRCRPERFEMALSHAVTLAQHAWRDGRTFTLRTQPSPCDDVPAVAAWGRGARSPDDLLRLLAVVRPLPEDGPDAPPAPGPRAIRLPDRRPA